MHYIMSFLKKILKKIKEMGSCIHSYNIKRKNKNKTSFINTSPDIVENIYIIIIIFFLNSFVHTFIFFLSRLKNKRLYSFIYAYIIYILKKIIKEIWDSFIHSPRTSYTSHEIYSYLKFHVSFIYSHINIIYCILKNIVLNKVNTYIFKSHPSKEKI